MRRSLTAQALGPKRRACRPLTRAQASGLPQRRDEYWKYTRPDAFVQADVTLQASQRSSLGLFDQRATISVAFEDGQIQAAALPSAAHCTLESLSSASAFRPALGSGYLRALGSGRTETGSTELGGCEHRCCAGGADLNVTGAVAAPIHIHATSSGQSDPLSIM